MQRVLSFNMGRSFGSSETSEFVTKRTCCFFLFSISFLGLLGGFLLGRLASDRTLLIREQRMLQELEGNGLHLTKDTQMTLLRLLNDSQFHRSFESEKNVITIRAQKVNKIPNETNDWIKDIFADLSIFRLNVEETKECTVATICGTKEPDRYIVLSASGEGFDVAIQLAKALDTIYRDNEWEPKRTLIFCVFLGSKDYCSEKFLERIKPKIVAYIALHGNVAKANDEIAVAGSGMIQATILDALNEIKLYHKNSFKAKHQPGSLPRLNFDVPHAVLSFLETNITSESFTNNSTNSTYDEFIEFNQKILAQILGLTIFRLSEGIFFQWNPKYFSEIMTDSLDTLTSEDFKETKDNLTKTLTKLVENLKNFNAKQLEGPNLLKPLTVRMLNDRLIDLDRALLCLSEQNKTFWSKTDITRFKIFPHESVYTVKTNLNEIRHCYKEANDIIRDLAYCKKIFIPKQENNP